jgi:hypothetical protein
MMTDAPTPAAATPAPAGTDKLSHPSFPQPEHPTERVWRYMDLPKLISLLAERQLYLPRLDLLNDPHEGSSTRLMARLFAEALRQVGAGHHIEFATTRRKALRGTMYVSCWRFGNDESEAMWRLYSPAGHGVAIQTTYSKLAQWVVSFPVGQQTYIGRVRYIDYNTEGFDGGNAFNYAMHKRKAFAHETEVRIIDWRFDPLAQPQDPRPDGVNLPFPFEEVLERIWIDPYAPGWFEKVVLSVVEKFAPSLIGTVEWSKMRDAPVW